MPHLLDVSVLVAWGWADHADHGRTIRWIAECKKSRGAKLYISSISKTSFVRVSVQRCGGRITIANAADVLRGMLDSLGPVREFLVDDLGGTEWPDWCAMTSCRTTDTHLLLLAKHHHLTLATLDVGISGAMLLPQPV